MTRNLPEPTLASLVVRPEDSIIEVMRAIDRNGFEVALVCDTGRRLLAVVTDGDIRRALIRGDALTRAIEGVGKTAFTSLPPGSTRAEALQLMLTLGIKSVPVIDADKRLVDLHTVQLALNAAACASWAVVMAGGKGERLGELTTGMPKPMLPIGDRPILEHIVQHLVSHGIRRIFLSVNYLGSMIEDHFGDGSRFHCRIDYLREREPLGTGGALGLLPERPTAPVLVMNGDLLTRINVGKLLDFHRDAKAAATLALRDHVVKVPFGVAEISGDRITRLVEKPEVSYLINAGIYVLEPQLLALIPAGVNYPITRLVEQCLGDGNTVAAYPMQEVWADIGVPEEYDSGTAKRRPAGRGSAT